MQMRVRIGANLRTALSRERHYQRLRAASTRQMTGWPRRKRSAVDDAMLTIAGCSTYLERQRGSLNGFYDPAAPLAREGAYESPSQRREREYARAWRVRLGPEAWQELVTAYAEERLKEIGAENMTIRKEANV